MRTDLIDIIPLANMYDHYVNIKEMIGLKEHDDEDEMNHHLRRYDVIKFRLYEYNPSDYEFHDNVGLRLDEDEYNIVEDSETTFSLIFDKNTVKDFEKQEGLSQYSQYLFEPDQVIVDDKKIKYIKDADLKNGGTINTHSYRINHNKISMLDIDDISFNTNARIRLEHDFLENLIHSKLDIKKHSYILIEPALIDGHIFYELFVKRTVNVDDEEIQLDMNLCCYMSASNKLLWQKNISKLELVVVDYDSSDEATPNESVHLIKPDNHNTFNDKLEDNIFTNKVHGCSKSENDLIQLCDGLTYKKLKNMANKIKICYHNILNYKLDKNNYENIMNLEDGTQPIMKDINHIERNYTINLLHIFSSLNEVFYHDYIKNTKNLLIKNLNNNCVMCPLSAFPIISSTYHKNNIIKRYVEDFTSDKLIIGLIPNIEFSFDYIEDLSDTLEYNKDGFITVETLNKYLLFTNRHDMIGFRTPVISYKFIPIGHDRTFLFRKIIH